MAYKNERIFKTTEKIPFCGFGWQNLRFTKLLSKQAENIVVHIRVLSAIVKKTDKKMSKNSGGSVAESSRFFRKYLGKSQ